jgi:septum formation protein
MQEIYLASKSPRRLELLAQMGIACRLVQMRDATGRTRDIDESPRVGESPYLYVERLAKIKAEIGWLRVAQRRSNIMPLLGADTTVVVGGQILGKPKDKVEAARMLMLLSGTTHEVLTAVAVTNGQKLLNDVSVSRVRFRDLNESEIDQYIETGEPLDKAGAYGIQGIGAVFIERIEGSYSGVMGLPIFETANLLTRMGVKIM